MTSQLTTPTAEPIVNQIEQELVRVLESILISNGYKVDCTVSRDAQVPQRAKTGLIHVEWADQEDITAEAAPYCHDAFIQNFRIRVFATLPEGRSSIGHRLSEYEAAIRKAVHANYTMGGRVYNYSWGDSETEPAEGGMPSRILPLKLHYRTLRGDPYNQ